MKHLTPLFVPRRQTRITSYKPSTVAVRERPMRRSGLSAATEKIYTKWRVRRRRVKERLMTCAVYGELSRLAPTLCKGHLDEIDKLFNILRDMELEKIKSMWENWTCLHTLKDEHNNDKGWFLTIRIH